MYAIAYRAFLRIGVCLALLYCFALTPSHAITKGDMGQFRYNKSGNTIAINPNQSGYGGASANISSWPSGSFNGSPIGQSGWYYGTGAASNPATGQTMTMGHFGDVYFAGTKYPFQAGYQVPVSALANALSLLCTSPITCAAAVATPAILDWLASNNAAPNTNASDYPSKPWLVSKKKYDFGCNKGYQEGDEKGGCFGNYGNGLRIVIDDIHRDGNTCYVYIKCSDGSHPHYLWDQFPANNSEQEYKTPVSPAEFSTGLKNPSNPADVIRDILDKGGDIDLPRPDVTGPSEVTGPTTTTKNPDGTSTTKQDKSTFKTQDNTITQTGTGKTDQKCDSTGKCETTTTEEKDPQSAEKQKALCEQYPDIIACAIGDTPKADIPKDSKEISYQAENIFGSGSCPSDRYLRLHNGQNLKVWDWQNSCEKIISIRPLVIALGGFAALMVLIPGLKGDLV